MTSDTIALLGEALIDVFPDRDVLGGAPFNVARNIAALGGQPLMVTRVGQDAFGDRIADEFGRWAMDARGLQRDAMRPTGTVRVHLQGRQHRFEIADDQAWDRLDAGAALRAIESARPAIVYFGTLAQRSAASRAAIRACIEATGAAAFLDLNLRDGPDNVTLAAESLALARVAKVNDDELERLLDWFVHPGQAPAAWGTTRQREDIAALQARFALQRLVVTRGSAGWSCFEAGADAPLEGRSPPVDVIDTVGAGDAFASVLLLGEVKRWPLATTLRRAGEFASAVCGIRGAVDSADARLYEATRAAWSAG